MIDKVKQGKVNRRKGAEFERKVRADLESNGWVVDWVVDRWSNNVDLEKNKLIQAKSFMGRTRTNGFPDFVISTLYTFHSKLNLHLLYGIECKTNGKLDKIEKAKCKWLLDNKVFGGIFIAFEEDKKIKYVEFK